MAALAPQCNNVGRIAIWDGHRAERNHRVGVIVFKQVRVDAQRRRHLLCPMNRRISSGGIPAATHRLA